MEEIKAVPRREECDKKYQWHIEDLYASDDLWQKDYELLEKSIPSLLPMKEGWEKGFIRFWNI